MVVCVMVFNVAPFDRHLACSPGTSTTSTNHSSIGSFKKVLMTLTTHLVAISLPTTNTLSANVNVFGIDLHEFAVRQHLSHFANKDSMRFLNLL